MLANMGDLRPIALCQVHYKIMSKMITNRLKTVLPNLISPSQSAFVAGRSIFDNSIVAYEVLHYMRSRRRGKDGYVALKIDISKAYDCLEWPFIRFMLQSLGFDAKFIDLVMFCVSTVSYQVLHQGQLLGPITPQRGVRQGDPLSPYLFILCAEGLSCMIRAQVAANALHGCIIATGAPQITHLFFADDSLLFFKAEISEAQTVQEVLNSYARMSGQVINFNKSLLCYSANVPAFG